MQTGSRRLDRGGCAGGVVIHPFLGYHPASTGPLAQLAEQQTLNLRVRGSIPWRLTIFPPRNHTLPPQEAGGLAAKVAELVYALDLGSSPERSGWGFESPLSHHRLMNAKKI